MTGLPLLLGLLSIAAAIGLGVYLLLGDRVPATTPSAAAPAGKGKGRPHPAADEPVELSSLLRRMAVLGAKLTPADYTRRVQHRLDLAGNPRAWTPERLLAFKGAGVVLGALIGFLLGVKHGPVLSLVLAAGFAAAGLLLPDVLVRNLGEKRQATLQKTLPDAMDMLTVCVEAGLGFDAALARVARNTEGAIAAECARVLQEMQFGMSRAEALRALGNRTTVSELRAFVAAMIQSGELGISIGDVLREQSKQMRIQRRQRAEERAQKLQVKLLAPLILCLLPAMFIVILGPAVMNIMSFFAKAR